MLGACADGAYILHSMRDGVVHVVWPLKVRLMALTVLFVALTVLFMWL